MTHLTKFFANPLLTSSAGELKIESLNDFSAPGARSLSKRTRSDSKVSKTKSDAYSLTTRTSQTPSNNCETKYSG